ncbi:unnamed protein product [Clonostachys rosea]|uniref:Ankyrin repeat protein n=1 Tax=Bionectria ochroleuca TaxID=29856 RepID=A0ABY6U4R9_BIOOC|nr:unnamed protein product [Clonostachys rosea]
MVIDDFNQLPARLNELVKYIAQHPEQSMIEIMEPYRRYEAFLRKAFAKDQHNPQLDDPYVNVLPLFAGDTPPVTVRARDLDSESDEEKSKYIMPLPEEKRRSSGSLATVPSLEDFRNNFSVFSEAALSGLDWSNVVAAGSSVVNCLLPVPEAFSESKRTLREYYHDVFCPASDVDLFLYGLTHDEAIEKIAKIEKAVKDALLCDVTVVRTKYAITIASQYPVRHVQIVLRMYQSVSEILTGFDIDAAGAAYDGKQVYVTPRALASFITQVNHVDLTRRSPSYENRLSKYSHRDFEVYWPDLERSRVDPTIFERSFKRTVGLARLLVLERLPTTSARDRYLEKRRRERGRPVVRRAAEFQLRGNIKDDHEDEIADWLEADEDVSSYTTFSIPYGERWKAKRIERLCYTRDLLLNAEWNQPDDQEIYLHRHPAFFGRVEDVVQDCCGSCPTPTTQEEIELDEKRSKIYISGPVKFLVDDPGRQEIGSFNPLTEQDWTDMAYVGNTARLCQSIVDGDVKEVEDWLCQDGNDINARDYTGRTPLHLAVISSTPAIVSRLVEHGARLIARLADGRTALHLAASRGDAEIIRILMDKSNENEKLEEELRDQKNGHDFDGGENGSDHHLGDNSSSIGELIEADEADTDALSTTTGSFVKINSQESDPLHPELESGKDEPDIYNIDVVAWDVPYSPLHLAIAGGHEDAVKALCDYGADSILPLKFLDRNNNQAVAILTLNLALSLPLELAKSMTKLLLQLSAFSSQADGTGTTAFHRFVEDGRIELVEVLLKDDSTLKKAINHIFLSEYYTSSSGNMFWSGNRIFWGRRSATAPLNTAIDSGDPNLVAKLLEAGADAQITFESWLKSTKSSPTGSWRLGDVEASKGEFRAVEQPIVHAISNGNFEAAVSLLEAGANPNTLTAGGEQLIFEGGLVQNYAGMSILDIVDSYISTIESDLSKAPQVEEPQKPALQPGIDEYLQKYKPGTYQEWVVKEAIKPLTNEFENQMEEYERQLQAAKDQSEAITDEDGTMKDLKQAFEEFRTVLVLRGSKPFSELYPHFKQEPEGQYTSRYFCQDIAPQPFQYKFKFREDQSITDRRTDGYIELMESAWMGDLDRIKDLTLKPWGPEPDQGPLLVAVYDDELNSPFSLAFLHGHYKVARAILEISGAQWVSETAKKVRYKMVDGTYAYDSGEDSDQPNIVEESLEYQYAIDNIGDEVIEAASRIKPFEIINNLAVPHFIITEGVVERTGTGSLFRHCFERNDATGMSLLIDLARFWATQKFRDGDEQDDDKRPVFSFPRAEFEWAIANGRTELISLVIEKTGAGVPLESLVRLSGFKENKKPKHYQGLTVYGQKRGDWAKPRRGDNDPVDTGLHCSPLLLAVTSSNIETVEYFMSNTPYRLYSEFAKSKAAQGDMRIQHLNQTPDGYERCVSKWLTQNDNDLIQWVMRIGETEHAVKILKLILHAYPDTIEEKFYTYTPLLTAYQNGYLDFIRVLIHSNANQSARSGEGYNLLHLLLDRSREMDLVKEALDLIDPDLRDHMFGQRSNLSSGGTTPIHLWISKVCGSHYGQEPRRLSETMELLLEYSKGQGVDLLSGAGDTCLHTAIMNQQFAIARVLVKHDASLLCRENAVGRTPFELVYDHLTAAQMAQPALLNMSKTGLKSILEITLNRERINALKKPKMSKAEIESKLREVGLGGEYELHNVEAIVNASGVDGSSGGDFLTSFLRAQVIWDLCHTALKENPHPRRLVSLNEANDVALRLGEEVSLGTVW